MKAIGKVLKVILIGVVALYGLIFSGIRACYRRWPKPTVFTGGALVGVFFISAAFAGVHGGVHGETTSTATGVNGTSAASISPSAEDDDAVEDADDPSGASATVTSAAASATAGVKALDVLATLPIKGRAPKTGYARDQFGDGWKDPDRNGCDARNDMLTRDLTDVVVASGGCKVVRPSPMPGRRSW